MEAQPNPETRTAAKPRQEADDYSYYSTEEEHDAGQDKGKYERFVAAARAAAQDRQRGRSSKVGPAAKASYEPAPRSSSEATGPKQEPLSPTSPGEDQEMQQAASPQPKPANKELVKESDSSDSSQAGDTSPNGPVETPKDEAAKEVQRRPRPDYAETMEFVVKLRKDVQPCHSRYHPELRVTYKNSGGDAGVTSTPLQVLGMGGSRVVAVAGPGKKGVPAFGGHYTHPSQGRRGPSND